MNSIQTGPKKFLNNINSKAPQYLMDFCQPIFSISTRQNLRSIDPRLLVVPRYRLSTCSWPVGMELIGGHSVDC